MGMQHGHGHRQVHTTWTWTRNMDPAFSALYILYLTEGQQIRGVIRINCTGRNIFNMYNFKNSVILGHISAYLLLKQTDFAAVHPPPTSIGELVFGSGSDDILHTLLKLCPRTGRCQPALSSLFE
jgi:hypothetical protein